MIDREHCDAEGSKKLAQRIKDYWGSRGRIVEVWTKEEAFTQAMRSGRFDVRSDMVNGYPPKPKAE